MGVKLKSYTVTVQETSTKTFVVDAENQEDALEYAENIYDTGDLTDYRFHKHLNHIHVKSAALIEARHLPHYNKEEEE